ncbi:hypothetical protein K7X08_007178 [Anisodus acutangulus]|uniref:Uncharacterized protein n=1 Tax=Anisodus acutangulus TaxID=402998 RepID=A0A9Q1R1C3_9SOLA|nr:hypothetical protein K7X08_007178 [Anisodus acutangulus]
MISTANGNSMMSNAQSPLGLKTYFKTPEGKYKLQYEKTYPAGLLHFSHGKTVTQVTLAHLKDKPIQAQSHSTSTFGVSSGVKSAAARLLGGGNGSKSLSFVGGNGGSKSVSGMGGRAGSFGVTSSNNSVSIPNFDGNGTYLIFNVGDTIFISDLNSRVKDPIKSIHFSNSNPICHAFDPDAKEGHDLLIGLSSGDVYSVSLRQQMQDVGKKLVGAQHYNKDGSVNDSRCTSIAWVPNSQGAFVVAHADGNFYVYDKSKDGSADPSFPVIKDQTHFSVTHARYSKDPVARWHICQGSINSLAFSADGVYIATVGRDGYLRIFDYKNEQLICGGKSYYGALLCCAWSMDGKYILAGGEDDLVQVWSMDERKVVAWGEGHNSWVSGVAFDSYWSAPNSDGTDENVVYRFGSVGQDTQLLLWDLEMDEIVVPMRRPHGGSPTFSTGSQSSHWDRACPVGTLQPAPSMRDIPKLSPLVTHHVHTEPLSGVMFTHESVLTICCEGHIKVWVRPEFGETPTSNSESLLSTSLKEKPPISGKVVSSKLQATT